MEALGTNLADFFQSSKEEQIVFHTQDFFVNEQEDFVTEYIVPNAQKNQIGTNSIDFEARGKITRSQGA